MRIVFPSFLIAVLVSWLACSATTDDTTVSDDSNTDESEQASPMTYVGVLFSNQPGLSPLPQEVCLEDGNLYAITPYSIHETYIYSDSYDFLEDIQGLPVVLKGIPKNDITAILTEKGTCSEENNETNMPPSKTKTELSQMEYILAYQATAFDGLKLIQQPKKLQVELKNTLQVPMEQITITGIYVSAADGETINDEVVNEPKLLPNKDLLHIFDLEIPEHGVMQLKAVQVKALGKDLVVDLEMPLR
jgi:hypothetical protein